MEVLSTGRRTLEKIGLSTLSQQSHTCLIVRQITLNSLCLALCEFTIFFGLYKTLHEGYLMQYASIVQQCSIRDRIVKVPL